MSRIGLIFIGHSHLSSIVSALVPRAGESYDPEEGCEYFIFNTMQHGAEFQFSVPGENGGFVLNPELVRLIDERVPRNYQRVFVSMFGGNAHNALTLLEHPMPFDFVLPEEPSCPRISGAELVAYGVISRFIFNLAEPYMLNLATLKNAFADPVIHIESPPPLGDDDFVLENLEGYFRDQAEDPKPAPRWLRYKLWRLHSARIREHAEAHGVEFLPAPAEAIDEDGFLLRSDYGTDSTHAGASYGLRILKQLEARMGMRYGGWSWL
jgi:hypothetical protein